MRSDFYTFVRAGDEQKRNLYEIWEKGDSDGDSVTPSISCQKYRHHLISVMKNMGISGSNLLSVGCGNGFVERRIQKYCSSLIGIDCNTAAVEIATQAGLDARICSLYESEKMEFWKNIDFLYLDGVLGHLFSVEDHLDYFFSFIKHTSFQRPLRILISNDAADDSSGFSSHQSVPDFWYIGKDFLADSASKAGFNVIVSEYFSYERPVSGTRNRTIVGCFL